MTRHQKLLMTFEILTFVSGFPLFLELVCGGILDLSIITKCFLGIISASSFITFCALKLSEFKKR